MYKLQTVTFYSGFLQNTHIYIIEHNVEELIWAKHFTTNFEALGALKIKNNSACLENVNNILLRHTTDFQTGRADLNKPSDQISFKKLFEHFWYFEIKLYI